MNENFEYEIQYSKPAKDWTHVLSFESDSQNPSFIRTLALKKLWEKGHVHDPDAQYRIVSVFCSLE